MSFDYDLFVIGGGSGGVRAARIAAGEYGARVGLAEESRMGGTCVIRGCVPKKLMIFAASGPGMAEEMRGYGWQGAATGTFSWEAFRQKLDAELVRLETIYTAGLEKAGVTIHKSRARLADHHTVELADGTRLTARHILIAVGGRPAKPGIPGEELGLISDDLFLMEELPRRALLVGGGFVACEFATILNGLGVGTVQVYRGDAVLRGFDREARDMATLQLSACGIDLRLRVNPTRLDRTATGIAVDFDDGSRDEFDAVFFATGRTPYTQGLGLENTGLRLTSSGAIEVDEWSQSPVPSIFAVGDVTDRVNLTPVAIREGHSFADTVFGAKPRKVRHDPVASAVYLRPHELGTIGLTEEEAAARGSVDVYAATFRPMQSMFAGSDAKVLMKLLVDPNDDRVLGCHIFGPSAGEMIQLAAIPITMGCTKADFDAAMAVHPTIAEELVTMRSPARRHRPDREAGEMEAGQAAE
ncbi:glutathione-disulfide reductase [Paracoccus siganidrum]|uniref:Glutathione-disulfide reductase n=1 Tax=Paracoccus siganidrum TaxID=1276757 RepID=A0A419A3U8_9RHOB|nr:glutathione-disulfide reductase [Paracoccus siganidrum]RJL08637.1 glutathione-disulfide reductase [Paracoccus siganidrum]RMC36774.1 glutathione-disulfide reductase [Paracoccus siganidrum]